MLSAQSKDAEAWILDSASSFHVTPRKEWFSSYKSGEFGFVGHLPGICGSPLGNIIIHIGSMMKEPLQFL